MKKIAKGFGVNVVNTPTGFKWMAQKLNNYEDDAILGIREGEGIGIDFESTELFTENRHFINLFQICWCLLQKKVMDTLPSSTVRDKDGNASSLAFAETLSYLKSLNIKPLDFLDKLYQKYGYHYEKTENIYFEGAEGSEKIKPL